MVKEGDDVIGHINKLKTLAENVEVVGAPVCKDNLMIMLLGSHRDSYQFLITALESRSDTLGWELVTSRLLHEEMKRKEQRFQGDGAVYTHDYWVQYFTDVSEKALYIPENLQRFLSY